MKKLFFFNTTIAAIAGNEGILRLTPISRERGIEICNAHYAGVGDFVSAIGHKASADAMTALLNRKIEENRIPAAMQHGDIAIALKLRGRIAEGQILDLAAMEAIGYDLVLMETFSTEFIISPFVGSTDCY